MRDGAVLINPMRIALIDEEIVTVQTTAAAQPVELPAGAYLAVTATATEKPKSQQKENKCLIRTQVSILGDVHLTTEAECTMDQVTASS